MSAPSTKLPGLLRISAPHYYAGAEVVEGIVSGSGDHPLHARMIISPFPKLLCWLVVKQPPKLPWRELIGIQCKLFLIDGK
ncbi:hypothetical protein [Bradyrhizobium sp. CCBAU 53380]|uniref:hypothetical protein n=1 Tax=Bradyrhizobium sp. CCBAU 53380 TaxID=1325117 RepID=UPI00230226D1|nr:hypothetical protein [Bradyrhizobium sp. CCBAU 53380]MDA9420777.1 hypothetical protein [Bradyrhizobium sp. CCBAU 53380]